MPKLRAEKETYRHQRLATIRIKAKPICAYFPTENKDDVSKHVLNERQPRQVIQIVL